MRANNAGKYADMFETCPYNHGNCSPEWASPLRQGFNPCFVDGAHDGNPEGVKQNGDIVMEVSPLRGF